MVEQTPEKEIKFFLRVKKNLLLFLTALIVCLVYKVRHDGEMPWADGVGAFFWSWLGSYLVLLLVLLLVGGISAATDNFFFGKRDPRNLGEKVHQIIIYVCITVSVVSLFLFAMFR